MLGSFGTPPQCIIDDETTSSRSSTSPICPSSSSQGMCNPGPNGPYKISRSSPRVRRASSLRVDVCFPSQKLRRSSCLVASIHLRLMGMVFSVFVTLIVRGHSHQKYKCPRTCLSHSNVRLSPEEGAVCNIRRRAHCLVSPFRDSTSGPG